MQPPNLPIIESCEDCGACCQRTPVPPFYPGEEAVRNVPSMLLDVVRDRVTADEHFNLIPCVWYDTASARCKHYDYRPQACRDFLIGSDLCRLSRWDEGIDK